jgi:hypothetical protein
VKRPVPAFLCLPLPVPASLLALLSLAAVGCGQNVQPHALEHTFDACAPLTVVTAPGLTAEQAQGVSDGIAMWNTGAATQLSTATSATPDVEAEAEADAGATGGARVPLVFQGAADNFHGLYDDAAAIVFINQDLTDLRPLSITVAHELGHVFGLLHVPADQRTSLMNSGNTTTELTPEDVDTLALLWGRCPR